MATRKFIRVPSVNITASETDTKTPWYRCGKLYMDHIIDMANRILFNGHGRKLNALDRMDVDVYTGKTPDTKKLVGRSKQCGTIMLNLKQDPDNPNKWDLVEDINDEIQKLVDSVVNRNIGDMRS